MSGGTPLLRITGLTHSFGGLRAVHDFSLSADRETVWGIIGPNGAGKSTVFNLITGVFDKPDNGTTILGGTDITGMPSHAIVAQGMSRTFQNIRLFKSMTVLDNVRTGAFCRPAYSLLSALMRTKSFRAAERATTGRATALLDAFGLGDRLHEYAGSLPYGMQRKVELCRALVSGPSVLLLDEPGAGMNPSELDGLTRLITQVRKEFDVAVVLIEHRMQLVTALCDYVKVLNFGETIFTGRTADLSKDQAVVKAYFGGDDAASGN
jgi:branched-chain amino acid transport system ATP-binding protein